MNNVLLQVETLGGLRIKAGDKVLLEQGARINKPWELLIFLLLNMDEPLTNEQICEALWEDDEVANPAGALKNAAYSLRKHLTAAGLPADCVMTRDREYCWNPATPVQLDVKTLNALFRQGRSEKTPRASWSFAAIFWSSTPATFCPAFQGGAGCCPRPAR